MIVNTVLIHSVRDACPGATMLIHATQTPDTREENEHHFFFVLALDPVVDETLAAREFEADDDLLPPPDLTFLICLFWTRTSAKVRDFQTSSTYHDAILGLLLRRRALVFIFNVLLVQRSPLLAGTMTVSGGLLIEVPKFSRHCVQ